MADEHVDDPEGDPPAPAPAPKPKPAAKPDPADPDDLSPEDLAAELRKVRKALKESNAEAQKGREAKRRLQELEDEKERLEQEKLSVDEKRERRLAELEAKAKEAEEKAAKLERDNLQMRFDNEVRGELKTQGVGMVEVCVKALRGDPAIEHDPDTGKVLGVKEAVSKLIKQNPELVTGMPRGQGTPRREPDPYRIPARDTGKPPGPGPVPDQSEIDRRALASELSYQL